jgi:hypothetical protein
VAHGRLLRFDERFASLILPPKDPSSSQSDRAGVYDVMTRNRLVLDESNVTARIRA